VSRIATFAVSASVLVGCAASSGVVPMGHDTYLISRSEKGFDTTGSRVKADALREASDYCAKGGKSIEITKATEKDMVPFRSDAQAEVQFKCK
jgi:hypothetical protein